MSKGAELHIDSMINFWQAGLFSYRAILSDLAVAITEEAIRALQKLKEVED